MYHERDEMPQMSSACSPLLKEDLRAGSALPIVVRIASNATSKFPVLVLMVIFWPNTEPLELSVLEAVSIAAIDFGGHLLTILPA